MKKDYRIKKEADFRDIMSERQSFANRHLVVYIRKTSQPHFKVGLSVGKKVGNAVERNRVKRLLRLSLKQMKPQIINDLEFVLIARPAIKNLSYEEVQKNVRHVLNLAGVVIEEKENKGA
ncbi:ribonuclease P protein component [Vagococcus xieshaowenii]|uniref:Ribonuclease P protein component n=1 Tax=Vagococcus xieshaowenii TaxID=2562451 RepID=A0AAJ5JM39_9ENTE|nr:ribonuclease P protein component [Vagococcus xieshaowenii]QCA27845.1 ribonuclease P protein component [Vagococcus xieshaowenii]TFZ42442.1 ribonuclease P protein component [Vagococcus xieshaowenii]